jgi:hypothetical protein
VYDGSRWRPASKWSTNDTFLWTPLTANARYRVAVWARGAGSLSDDYEACAEVGFAIADPVTRRTSRGSEARQPTILLPLMPCVS